VLVQRGRATTAQEQRHLTQHPFTPATEGIKLQCRIAFSALSKKRHQTTIITESKKFHMKRKPQGFWMKSRPETEQVNINMIGVALGRWSP
jgi:hypothetical protein